MPVASVVCAAHRLVAVARGSCGRAGCFKARCIREFGLVKWAGKERSRR
jgi:hypothetical protein